MKKLKHKQAEGTDIESVIIFAEVIKPSGSVTTRDLSNYHRLIDEFQSTMHLVITEHLKDYRYKQLNLAEDGSYFDETGQDYVWSIEGDEARIFLHSGDSRYDLFSALLLALKMKLSILASDLNQEHIHDGIPLVDISIGLHIGKVERQIKPWHSAKKHAHPRMEGFSIEIVKKVAEQARLGYFSKISATHEFQNRVREIRILPCQFYEHSQIRLENVGESEAIFELVGFFSHEVYWFLPKSYRAEIMERVLTIGEMYCIRRPYLWLSLLLMRYFLDEGTLDFRKEKELSKIIEFGSAIIKEYGSEIVGYLRYFIYNVHNIVGMAYEMMAGNTEMELYQEKAEEEFNTVLALDSDNIAANYHLGRIKEKAGNYSQSLRHYQTVLVRDPNNYEASHAEARVREFIKK